MQTLLKILRSTLAPCPLLPLPLATFQQSLPSTVEIVDLELQDPPTDDEMTKTRTKKVTFDLTDLSTTTSAKTTDSNPLPCLKAASIPCQHADSLPCLQAAGLPCASAADEAGERAYCDPPTELEVERAFLGPSTELMSLPRTMYLEVDCLAVLPREAKA